MSIVATRIAKPTIEARCNPGDLWQLGEHRLLCGDATKSEDVARLMQGERFVLAVTSPPYDQQRTYNLDGFDWHSMMCNAFDVMTANGRDDCHIIVNLGLTHRNRQVNMYWLPWLMHCASVGWPLFGWYIWDKGNGLPGDWNGRLATAHEFLFDFNKQCSYPRKWIKTTGHIGGTKSALRDRDGQIRLSNSLDKYGQPFKIPDSVVRLHRAHTTGKIEASHPAVFPVSLPEFAMKTWSDEGDVVYEPFCGSGTTILAAENLGRRCYAIDISPEYCDVALTRYEAHTGTVARRISPTT